MKDAENLTQQRKSAKSIGLAFFFFMCCVSIIIFFTEEKLDFFDFVLMIGAPVVLSVFSYFVVLHHDSEALD